MSSSSSADERHDYLVRARAPATLGSVVQFITGDPAFHLLRQMGPANEPHTLVVSTTEQGAALLRQRGELIVERDSPLKLF